MAGLNHFTDNPFGSFQVTMKRANSVRIPPRWEAAHLSLLLQPDESSHRENGDAQERASESQVLGRPSHLQIFQERGYAQERRIVALEDIAILCLMTKDFRTAVEDPQSSLSTEDWDELNKQWTGCLLDKEQIVSALAGCPDEPKFGAVYVKSGADVLIVAQFGHPAYAAAEWTSPAPPMASIMAAVRSGPCC
jgi:hypothetical protein